MMIEKFRIGGSTRVQKKLENEKMEVIFAQVKRGIKNENLDVTSASVLKMVGVLREIQITEKE